MDTVLLRGQGWSAGGLRIQRISLVLGGLLVLLGMSGCSSEPVAGDYVANSSNAEAIRKHMSGGGSGAGGGAAAQADPQGWGTLRGVFKLNGSPPPLPNLTVDKDLQVCGANPIPNESLVVGSDNGIANVIVYLVTDIPSNETWEHPSYLATKDAVLSGPQGFDQKGCLFLSHAFAMRSTQKVEVINSDSVGHNTNLSGDRGAKSANFTVPANSKDIYDPGGQANQPFSVKCSIHPWMSAYMIVRDNPYFAVTDSTGQFEIKNVPAGVKLEFRVWQEQAKFIEKVSVGGEATTWRKGRFEVTLADQQTTDLDVVVDASVFQ